MISCNHGSLPSNALCDNRELSKLGMYLSVSIRAPTPLDVTNIRVAWSPRGPEGRHSLQRSRVSRWCKTVWAGYAGPCWGSYLLPAPVLMARRTSSCEPPRQGRRFCGLKLASTFCAGQSKRQAKLHMR